MTGTPVSGWKEEEQRGEGKTKEEEHRGGRGRVGVRKMRGKREKYLRKRCHGRM